MADLAPSVLRKEILRMARAGASVHIGCAFSIVEIVSCLCRDFLLADEIIDKKDHSNWLLLSKGHGVMAQYACMRELGWLGDDAFTNYFADGSELKGLSDSRVPGLEVTSGSLGHGFSVAVGLAFGSKLKATAQKTYALVGDGELNEGAIWEGALFAAHHGLKNFMVIVDENGFQAMGPTQDVIQLGSLQDKFKSFGFEVAHVDGHDETAIDHAIRQLWASDSSLPKALIAKTVKGKGVPFMENNNEWHYTRLNDHTYAQAMSAVMATQA